MRIFYYILLAIVVGVALINFGYAEPITDTEQSNTSSSDAEKSHNDAIRTGFKIPEFFNFARFKQMFDKHYSSLIEEIVRKKIFLGRCFASFISMFKYKHRQVSHFLRINQMSDETPQERSMRYPDAGRVRVSERDILRTPAPEVLQTADEEDLARELASIEDHKDEPGFKDLAEELEVLRNADGEHLSRRRRSPTLRSQTSKRDLPADKLLNPVLNADESEEAKRKMRSRVPSNNPEHQPLELASSAAPNFGQQKPIIDLTNILTSFKEVPILGTAINTVQEMYAGTQVKPATIVRPPADKMIIDYRQKNCHFLPRKQGDCGSCYAFAAISLFEYAFCMDTGLLVPFSEQYVVDCGHREKLNACNGGRPDYTLKFIERYGLEFRSDYPYLARNQTCPYDEDTSHTQMGTIKVDSETFGLYDLKHLDHFLKKRPVLTSVKVTPDFSQYGGGVDDAVECNGGPHAMLVVGYGREDGKYFYLFRNSHSVTWGDLGYYKLNAKSLERCATDPFVFISLARFVNADKNMNKHNTANIKAYYNNLLIDQKI